MPLRTRFIESDLDLIALCIAESGAVPEILSYWSLFIIVLMAWCIELILVIVFLQLYRVLLSFQAMQEKLKLNIFKFCGNSCIILVCT